MNSCGRRNTDAFIKALSNLQLSPVFLRELRKEVTAGKKKALAASKANASALEHQSGVVSESLTCDSLQLPFSKRKADELSSSDGPSETASRRPVAGHLFGDGPAAPRVN